MAKWLKWVKISFIPIIWIYSCHDSINPHFMIMAVFVWKRRHLFAVWYTHFKCIFIPFSHFENNKLVPVTDKMTNSNHEATSMRGTLSAPWIIIISYFLSFSYFEVWSFSRQNHPQNFKGIVGVHNHFAYNTLHPHKYKQNLWPGMRKN